MNMHVQYVGIIRVNNGSSFTWKQGDQVCRELNGTLDLPTVASIDEVLNNGLEGVEWFWLKGRCSWRSPLNNTWIRLEQRK